jgi:hypothetical protein
MTAKPIFKSRFAFLFLLSTFMVDILNPQQNRIRSVTTGGPQGSVWLQWDERTRLGFVRGYLLAISVGYRDGCFWYDDFVRLPQEAKNPAELPFAKCLASGLKFSQTPEYYSKQLTTFYKSYPQDTRLPLDELLRSISDSQNKSLKEIDDEMKR